jgi:hypothetical protein
VNHLLEAGRIPIGGNALTTLATSDGVPHARPREPIAGTGNKEWQSESGLHFNSKS